ncbi:MAG: hypothetical protein ABJZ55_17055 [Fuerstiella sp.]
MFHLDLKRAAVALAASRLDDAFDVLTTSKERTHRDAQTMIDQLAHRFVERAQLHLTANRLQDAEHDAGRAHELAGNRPEVAQIFATVQSAIQKANARRQGRNQVLAEAQQQAKAGQFSLGQKLLDELPRDDFSERGIEAAHEVEQLLGHRRQVIEHVVQQVADIAKNQSPDAVVAKLQDLTDAEQCQLEISKFKNAAIQSICDSATRSITDGRIDKAISALESLQTWKHPAIEELAKLLSCCSTVNTAISRQDFSTAETSLRLLNQLISTKWISVALKHVQTISEQLKQLQSGPLGLLAQFDQTIIEASQTPSNPSPKVKPLPTLNSKIASNGRVLQVDGIGSLLLQTQDVITIGTASRTRPVDVGLLTDGQTEPVVIRRTSEDYFAESALPFTINGRKTNRHLLQNGDSIEIGDRGRLKFSKPVAASSSAVLAISGAKLQRRDIRHIVLLSDSVLFGATGCHFKLPGTTTPVLLHRSGHDFAIRELGQEPQIMQTGSPVSVQHVRFALADVETIP